MLVVVLIGPADDTRTGTSTSAMRARAHQGARHCDSPLPDVMSDRPSVGVGPHPQPWPDDPRLDHELLAYGDRRNVVDRYRYWSGEAIIADLDAQRHPFHVAVENWQYDFNIGTVVRNANAFLASAVHIIGSRRWNRRGAMVTDRYQHVHHHVTLAEFRDWSHQASLPLIGVDLLPGSVSITEANIPRACVLLFGQEGPGLSEEARVTVDATLHVPQWGSTRSINAGVASGIAMFEWCRRHAIATHAEDRAR